MHTSRQGSSGRIRSFAMVLLAVFITSAPSAFAQKSKSASAQASGPQRYKKDLDRGVRGDYDNDEIKEQRREFLRERALSSVEKDIAKIRQRSYDAWRSMDNRAAFKTQSMPAWKPIAGSQLGLVSGRLRSMAFDPNDQNIIYIASAQGGIWKTENIMAEEVEWVNLSERLPTLSMGAIAVDPKDGRVIYAGTGETMGGHSTPDGAGLFKSTDGGLNWTLLEPASGRVGTSVSEIAIDPINTNNVFVAAAAMGLLRSTDGGLTWAEPSIPSMTSNVGSVYVHPTNPSIVLAASLSSGRLARSTDGGVTWTSAVPPGLTGGQRAVLAGSAGNPDVVYASIMALSGKASMIFRTTDAGESWTLQNTGTVDPTTPQSQNSNVVNYLWNSTQGNYANAIGVHPTDAHKIVVGGLQIYRSTDSGKKTSRVTNNYADPTQSSFVHADVHVLKYSPDGKVLYSLTDGGIAYSLNNGASWIKKANKGLATLQFVGVDADRDFTYVIGGTQDNGVNKAGINDAHWDEARGGDGGWTRVAEDEGSIMYTTSVRLLSTGGTAATLHKSRTAGETWESGPAGSGDMIGANTVIGGTPFYPAFDISAGGGVVALGATSTIFVSTNGAEDGLGIKGLTASGGLVQRVYSIHISKSDPSFMWAGKSGSIVYSRDMGETWTSSNSGIPSGSGQVTGIVASTSDPSKVYAVSYNTSTSKPSFLRSTDGGEKWSAPATNLPSFPLQSITRAKNGTLFAGSDFGVIYSQDDGVTWYPLGQGLPLLQVLSLSVRGKNDEYLLAGTFGRGAFYLDISDLPAANQSSVDRSEPTGLSIASVYPNPASSFGSDEVTISFTLKEAAPAILTLHDVLGREQRILAKTQFDAGSNSLSFSTAGLTPGSYFISLVANGRMVSEKFVVR